VAAHQLGVEPKSSGHRPSAPVGARAARGPVRTVEGATQLLVGVLEDGDVLAIWPPIAGG
jgi:hypothetical protein